MIKVGDKFDDFEVVTKKRWTEDRQDFTYGVRNEIFGGITVQMTERDIHHYLGRDEYK